MGWHNPDVYNQPEHFGLKPIGEIDDPDADYSFDILAVWEHEDGRIFYAEDGGCSCPAPFEDFDSLDKLTEVTPATWDRFQQAVGEHPHTVGRWVMDEEALLRGVSKSRRVYTDDPETVAKMNELLAKVSALVPR